MKEIKKHFDKFVRLPLQYGNNFYNSAFCNKIVHRKIFNNQLTVKFFYSFPENSFCSTSEDDMSLKLQDFPF